MLYRTAAQGAEFAFMIPAGMMMAAVSLGFFGLRRLTCAGRMISLICDILMGVAWAAIGCGALYAATRGSLRLYHILAAGAGAALFHAAIAAPIRNMCSNICRRLRCTCEKLGQNRLICRIFR